ncbi:MAG TPA: hypothetical protein VGV89_01660 [Thermoplasmata archaeon]|nr:hypothetical protein [Thermoplasmata archaeon]
MQAPPPLAATAGDSRMRFVVVVFAVGAIMTAVVGYFGFTGQLGAGIVGTEHGSPPAPPPLTACQGHGALGSFHFQIVAGPKGTFTFNGSSPGPCFAVAVGSTVVMEFQVAHDASALDSWELIAGTGPTDQAPVFPGAGWSDSTRFSGLGAGGTTNFTFHATTAGQYRYVSEVGNHAAVGEWGSFNVTTSALSVSPVTPRVDPIAGASGVHIGAPAWAGRSA